MARLIALFIAVFVAACDGDPNPGNLASAWGSQWFQEPEAEDIRLAGPVLVFQTEKGRLVYELYMDKAHVVAPVVRNVDENVYSVTYIDRNAPGTFVQIGGLTDGPRFRIDGYVTRYAKPGELGVKKNADGSYGPELILVRGSSVLEVGHTPNNDRIGRLIEGRDVLWNLKRGDRIIDVYGRNFPSATAR